MLFKKAAIQCFARDLGRIGVRVHDSFSIQGMRRSNQANKRDKILSIEFKEVNTLKVLKSPPTPRQKLQVQLSRSFLDSSVTHMSCFQLHEACRQISASSRQAS